MKIKIHFENIGLCVTLTYLKEDGDLTFNNDGKSGIIHTESGDHKFEVITD